MKRNSNHPHARVVLAALRRAAASPYARADALVQNVAGDLIGEPEAFAVFIPVWSAAGARAVVLAWMRHAPAGTLKRMAQRARKQIAWVERWDAGERASEVRRQDELKAAKAVQ